MDVLHAKKQRLEAYLRDLGHVAVAFSAGVDSTFLLKTAHDALGERAIALTARSCFFPAREWDEAQAFCRAEGIEQIAVDVDVLAVSGVADNPPDRCYYCKRALFSEMRKAAAARGFSHLAEGSNTDDEGDYRPGLAAVRELGIHSPLRAAGLCKAEIRALSREMGLPTAEKPSLACLASRVAYGERLTAEKLQMVDKAEQVLRGMGFRQVRVRVHGDVARVEIEQADFAAMLDPKVRSEAHRALREIGFLYVALDLAGYRTGSMNRALEI